MCVNFTNLNSACSNDSYPLPCIDTLVDRRTGYKILSFMDAYSRYNQVKMHKEDEEKTTFITEMDTYCYVHSNALRIKKYWRNIPKIGGQNI